jgi:hypothetical protein
MLLWSEGKAKEGLLFCKKEAKNFYSPVACLMSKSLLVLFLEKGRLSFFDRLTVD